jgi:hypothetical protein
MADDLRAGGGGARGGLVARPVIDHDYVGDVRHDALHDVADRGLFIVRGNQCTDVNQGLGRDSV